MEPPPYIKKRMATARRSEIKTNICKKSNPAHLHFLIKYVELSDKDFLYIGDFSSDEWMTYGAMKEYEYHFNRNGADEKATGKSLLDPTLYQEVIDNGNPIKYLTFRLYLAMREEEIKFEEEAKAYNKKLDVIEKAAKK